MLWQETNIEAICTFYKELVAFVETHAGNKGLKKAVSDAQKLIYQTEMHSPYIEECLESNLDDPWTQKGELKPDKLPKFQKNL